MEERQGCKMLIEEINNQVDELIYGGNKLNFFAV